MSNKVATTNGHIRSGMKTSKSDYSNLSSHNGSKGEKTKIPPSPLGKTFISKSHENLSTHQKKKLATLAEPRPKSTLGITRALSTASNKENFKDKDKAVTFSKKKAVKVVVMPPTPIRKASSTQSIDKSGSTPSKLPMPSNKSSAMKRAHSSHNVGKEKSVRKRTSAPADVMAYNAELLANFEKEKKQQEQRISELIQIAESRKGEIEKYKYEVKRLKEQITTSGTTDDLDVLKNENKLLQERLNELGCPVEQITDSEKLYMLQNAGKHSDGSCNNSFCIQNSRSCENLTNEDSKPLSSWNSSGALKLDLIGRSTSLTVSEPEMTSAFINEMCTTPDHPSVFSADMGKWEKESNKSSDGLSEISVACLTERILQMEETHYSTNEELQATLQELGDLQDAVNELTDENEKLTDEKFVLLESLCAQTEKLESCRTQIEQLKCLLISGTLPDRTEREKQLLELLKMAQDEREELLRKQLQLANSLHSSEEEYRETIDIVDALKDKSHILDEKANILKSDKEVLEQQVFVLKETSSNDQLELARYKTLLENEKSKVQELEQYCKAEDKSELEELLCNARREKDQADEKMADLKDALAHCECDGIKLKEQLFVREEELKAYKNNAKSQLDEIEFRMGNAEKEKNTVQQEMKAMREHIQQLEQGSEQAIEEKKSWQMKVESLEHELLAAQKQHALLHVEHNSLMKRYDEESEEWHQFQKDLQVAVVIANDFRAETQDGMERVTNENQKLKEKCNNLRVELDKVTGELELLRTQNSFENRVPKSIMTSAELKGKVISTVDRELLALRDTKKRDSRSQNFSVKSLIKSLEEQVKSSPVHSSSSSSRRNSDTTDSVIPSLTSLQEMCCRETSPTNEKRRSLSPLSEFPLKSVLKKSSEKASTLQRHQTISSFNLDKQRSPGEPVSSAVMSETDMNKVSPITSVLSGRATPRRSSSGGTESERKDSKDPLLHLSKQPGGSKRNALLKWCQMKTVSYSNVDITNFSSSWNDGLAFCALIDSYLPNYIPYNELNADDKRRNFGLAFEAAESVGVPSILNITDMVAMERPDWQAVMTYVTSIYKHFEVDGKL